MIDIYYAFINSHISWASTNPTKLKILHNKQKHAARNNFKEDRMTHARPLMKQLNVYRQLTLNIFINNTIEHKYPTNYATDNFIVPKQKLKISKFSISIRCPIFWNDNKIKNLTSLNMFQNQSKINFLLSKKN